MKRFTSRVQNLGQKAAQIQAAIKSVPPKIADIRETVAMTTNQLQQLRANVQSSVAELRVDDPERVIEALQEINDNAAAFEEAGYVLSGVDMELSPVERLIVHLDKLEDVPHSSIRSLIGANQNRRTVHALLTSLLQAEAVADRVAMSELSYRTLIVHVGPIPSVRLCWRSEEGEESIQAATASAPAAQVAISSDVNPGATSVFAQSSFFEPRSSPSAAAVVSTSTSEPKSAEAERSSTQREPTEAASTSMMQSQKSARDWKAEAFERLKKNPHVSKYGTAY